MTSDIDSSFAALNINRHVFDDTDNIRTYEKDFKRNNPTEVHRSSTSTSTELKNIFAKFDVASKQISPEILEKTRDLCAKYLGGAWSKVNREDFQVTAITGGMSNLLFLVKLPSHLTPIGSEPDAALLRIHGQSDVEQLLTESVIFTMLSERHLGPKLLGVFPGGRFEQFIPSRCLQCEEIAYPTMSSVIGNLLARVHTLDVPITKEPNMIALAESWLKKLRSTPSGTREWNLKPVKAKVDMDALPKTFSCESLAREMVTVKRCMNASRSPIVFCHNDLQEGNVLLYNKYEYTSDGTLQHVGPSTGEEEPLVLIDFEYASYNYRGFDLGNHFCEYGIDYDCNEAPGYKVHNERFPDAEERRRFLSAYIDEVYKLRETEDNPHFPLDLVTGNRERDLETLVEESLRFMSVSNFFWTIWSLLQAEESIVEDFDFHSYAQDRLALYYHQREHLLKYIEMH
ncbi:hypothetical protein L596_004679 [Steinernema carpocapsae]|uniref:Choline kinase N-terminal domain-containing protein n=1 Tax=Steinernema carpocapsae TaxID=34508 RepID=A0A4U8UWN4_STECR|nr:hypothetical protein L596_004679 [Steinernema carpocapsae]